VRDDHATDRALVTDEMADFGGAFWHVLAARRLLILSHSP
jgi:hypothetical protein